METHGVSRSGNLLLSSQYIRFINRHDYNVSGYERTTLRRIILKRKTVRHTASDMSKRTTELEVNFLLISSFFCMKQIEQQGVKISANASLVAPRILGTGLKAAKY